MGLAGVLDAGATGQDKDSGGQRMRRDRNRQGTAPYCTVPRTKLDAILTLTN